MGSGIPDTYFFYHYNPSTAAAVAFIIIFSLLTLVHAYQMVRTKTWHFLPFVLGGQTEIIGYVARILSHNNTNGQRALGAYIVQATCLLVAAALYAASIYMILVRIARLLHAEHHLPIRASILTKLFVFLDVISFNMQGLGGGLMAAVTLKSTGEKIIIAGIWVQIASFSVFVVLERVFLARLLRAPTGRAAKLRGAAWRRNWRFLMGAVEVVAGLVMVRSVFRLVEYSWGEDGELMMSEAWIYGFDACLMAAVMVVMAVFHPSGVLEEGRAWERVGQVETEEMSALA